MKKRILFYSDATEFGGHELMGIEMANTLTGDYEVHFLYHHNQIGKRLVDTVNATHISQRTQTGPFAFIRNMRINEIAAICSLIRTIQPDISIILQPAIDFCIKGALASKLSGVRTVSYIPMCFSVQKLQSRAYGKIVDCFFGLYYRLFDSFITISEAQRAYITNATHGNRTVYIVNNVIGSVAQRKVAVGSCDDGTLRIGVIGRISFHQKRHDRLLEIAKLVTSRRDDFKIVIKGDGPDRKVFEKMIIEEGLENYFEITGWIENKEEIYSDIDFVLMVSDFEGVPLTMIESLCCKKMVVGYETWGTEVYRDYIDSRFLCATCSEVADLIANADVYMAEFDRQASRVQRDVMGKHSHAKFKDDLLFAIRGVLS